MRSLPGIIKTYFSDETEKKHAKVDLRDRWVLVKDRGLLSSWYPRPVDFVETDRYLFFDRRKANMYKAYIYGGVSFVMISGLTFVFFGYFSWLFLLSSLFMAAIFFGILFAAARSLTFGVIVVPKSWVDSVEETHGWIVVKGREEYGSCKSLLCALEPWQVKTLSPVELLWHATDAEMLYEVFGSEGRFEIKYRAARMRK
jgi:hypothetical protein